MQQDAIWDRARADLAVPTKHGNTDWFLYEHSARVARNAQAIHPLVQNVDEVDPCALLAAALYHDAGWAARCKGGEIERIEMLLTPLTEALCEYGVDLLRIGLNGVLEEDVLERAVTAVRSLNRHGAGSAEGRIVYEANNLDEFGVMTLWTVARRGVVDGKGIQSVLDMWQRKREYQFWTARLDDSFFTPQVRQLAEHRLKLLDHFMDQLAEQHHGRDLEQFVTQPVQPQPDAAQPGK